MRTLDGGDIGIHKHMVVVDERGNWYAMTGGEEMHGCKKKQNWRRTRRAYSKQQAQALTLIKQHGQGEVVMQQDNVCG